MNPTQRLATADQRRQQVAALYLQGLYQSEIAQKVGVTQQQVSHDLRCLRKVWLASAMRDFDALKAEQLAKIDAAERAYWEGWQRSLQPREVTLTKQSTGKDPRDEASIRRETPVGDPRFLDGVMRCIAQRADILGISTSTEAAKAVSTGLAVLLAQAKGVQSSVAPLAEA